MIFGEWDPGGGTIPCEWCFHEADPSKVEECEECGGEQTIEIPGSALEAIGSAEELQDACTTAWTILSCRERSWTPEEYLSQPPKWLAALHFAMPYLMLEYEAELERRRKEAKAETWPGTSSKLA